MFLSKTDMVQLDMVPSIVDKVVFAVTISPSFFSFGHCERTKIEA